MRIPRLKGLLQSNLALAALAVLAGAIAAWVAARQLDRHAARIENDARQRYATAPYVVASRDVARGQQLDASMLSIRSMPRAFAPADAVSPADAGLLVGGRAAVGIRRGTPVVQASLAEGAERKRLSEMLPEGTRALTIQVDQLNAISGRLQAGDTVDVFYSRTQGSGAVLKPLLQRVRVLATGDMAEDQELAFTGNPQVGDFSAVTLLLAVSDAQKVVLAEQTGRLTLVLRRSGDAGVVAERTVDSRTLLRSARVSATGDASLSFPVEVLTGGHGGAPSRSWLRPGEGA